MNFPAAQIRWLFFDLGNTLVSEDKATEHRTQQLADCFARHGRRCSVEEIHTALEQASAEFAPRPLTAAIAKLTGDFDLRRAIEASHRYPKELESPYDRAEQTLRTLSQHYRIGVIANQPFGTAERLARWGLMPFVSICLSSAELGIEKPDPAIFRFALSCTECAPEEAVMIGDRLDNDIRPTRLQGWGTIRILQGFARFQAPRDEFDEPDATVARLTELPPLLLAAIA